MLKKTVTILVVALLLSPVIVRAQSEDKPSLAQVQAQAIAAHHMLAIDLSSINWQQVVAIGAPALVAATAVWTHKDIQQSKIKFQYQAKEAHLQQDVILEKRIANNLYEHELQTSAYLRQFQQEVFEGLPYNAKEFDLIYKTDWVQTVLHAKGAQETLIHDYVKKALSEEKIFFCEQDFLQLGFDKAESKALANWLNHLRTFAKYTKHPAYIRSLLNLTEQATHYYPLKQSLVPQLFSKSVLKRLGLLGIGLVAISTAANASSTPDARFAKRVVDNPNLFLQANAEELHRLEQNPITDSFCREYTHYVQQMASMPADVQQEFYSLMTQDKAVQQQRVTNMLKKSLHRSVNAR